MAAPSRVPSNKSFSESSAGSIGRKITRKPTHFSVIEAVHIDAESLRNRRAHWITENPEATNCRGRAVLIVESAIWEIIVTIAICIDMGLTVASFILPPDESDSLGLFLAGASVLLVLVVDVVLRITKDGRRFFFNALNWIEFAVAIVGLISVIVEIEDRLSSAASGPRQPGASLGRTIRPVLRVFRVFRGFFTFFAGRGGIKGRINKGVDKLFDHLVRKQLVDFLLMPAENMKIQPSLGILHLEKAQIRSKRLTDLHLPLNLTAGIFDMVHFELKLGKLRMGHHRLMVFMQNVILVVGPGRGEERAADWKFEDVLASKSKTVKLACKAIEPFAKPRKKDKGPEDKAAQGSVRHQTQVGSSWIRRKLTKLLRDILNNGMQICIHDFEIRYEDDTSGICGPYRIVGGFVVDSLQLRAVSAGQGHGDETHLFRAKGQWRPGLAYPEEGLASQPPSSWQPKSFSETISNAKKAAAKIFDFSHGVHGGLHGHGIKVFWEMFPRSTTRVSEFSSEGLQMQQTTATSQFRLRLQEDSGCNVSDFLKTRKILRKWERLRYGISRFVMQQMLDERQGPHAVHLSQHRLREKARRLRDIIGQHKYLVEPCNFSLHFVCLPFKGSGGEPHLDVDLDIQELSTLLDMTQLKGLAAIIGYVQRWVRQDNLFQWKPPPSSYRQAADISGSGLSKGRLLWAYALKLVLRSIHPRYHWTSLSWVHIRRSASLRHALFEALVARGSVDQTRVEVLQVSLPLLECLAIRREAYIELATRKQKESYFQKKRCCRRRSADDPTEALGEGADDEEDFDGGFDLVDSDESEEEDLGDGGDSQPMTMMRAKPEVSIAMQEVHDASFHSDRPPTPQSPQEKETSKKFRIFGSEAKKHRDKLDLHAACEFMQFAVHLRKFYFDLLYPPGANGRRRALLRWGMLHVQSMGVRGAPYRLWSSLVPPIVVISAPIGDLLHKHPAFSLQVTEASAVFSAAPKEGTIQGSGRQYAELRVLQRAHDYKLSGPELRSFLAFDRKRMSPEKFEKAGQDKMRPVFQLRAARLHRKDMTDEEVRNSPWGKKGIRSIPAPWNTSVCVEPFQANICKAFVLRVRDFLLSYLSVPKLDPAKITKKAFPHAGDLEDPSYLWVELTEIRKVRHQRHRNFKFGRRLETALGMRGPLANGQRFFGSVIFPGGFSVMVLDLYHESRWMKYHIQAPPGSSNFHRLGWPVDGTSGYRPFRTFGLEPFRASDGWWFETEQQCEHFVAIQAKEGAEAAQTDGDWEADGFEIEESPFTDAWAPPVTAMLSGSPPPMTARGLPRQPPEPPKKPEVKENVLLSCAAQVAGPAALFAASMAAEAGRSAAARMTAAIPIPACIEVQKAEPTQEPAPRPLRRRRSSLSLPKGETRLAKNAASTNPTAMIEEDAVSVHMEVLPKGALGILVNRTRGHPTDEAIQRMTPTDHTLPGPSRTATSFTTAILVARSWPSSGRPDMRCTASRRTWMRDACKGTSCIYQSLVVWQAEKVR
eukprot:s1185_g1.t1